MGWDQASIGKLALEQELTEFREKQLRPLVNFHSFNRRFLRKILLAPQSPI